MKYLWLAVTPDKYEFPIYIEDSAQALADKLGTTSNVVSSAISKNQSGKKTGRKIIKISVDT